MRENSSEIAVNTNADADAVANTVAARSVDSNSKSDNDLARGVLQNTAVKNKPDFAAQIDSKANRKLKAKSNSSPGVWFGLGMMGMIGWSVVVPTLLGAASGLWLDKHYPSTHSWTLALLIGGLSLGCINAWYWVDKEAQTMREEPKT